MGAKRKDDGFVRNRNELSQLWIDVAGEDYWFVPETEKVDGGWRWWHEGRWQEGANQCFLGHSTVAIAKWRDGKGREVPVVAGSDATAKGGMKFSAARRTRRLAEWDASPYLLAINGGQVLDLDRDTIRPMERGDLITRHADVTVTMRGNHSEGYAGTPTQDFLYEKVPSPGLREWLGRWCGYCLSGLVREQLAVFLLGDTSTGKTTLRLMLAGLLGGYHFGVRQDIFAKEGVERSNEKGYALARAPGMRLLTVPEWSEGAALDEALFTEVTGGDIITPRAVRGVPFDVRPQFKVMLVGNHLPSGRLSPQVLRRLVVVPMDESHEHEPDVFRAESLTSPIALGHFLEWCLDGWRRYRVHGLRPLPEESQAIGRKLAKAAEQGARKDLEARMKTLMVNRKEDSMEAKMVNEYMLAGVPASSREGRAITRWLRARYGMKTVKGYPHYTGLPVQGESG